MDISLFLNSDKLKGLLQYNVNKYIEQTEPIVSEKIASTVYHTK